jgi:cell division protein FtsZ
MPNYLKVYGNKISLIEAFKKANNVLFEAVRGISDMITRPGMINFDFADVVMPCTTVV